MAIDFGEILPLPLRVDYVESPSAQCDLRGFYLQRLMREVRETWGDRGDRFGVLYVSRPGQMLGSVRIEAIPFKLGEDLVSLASWFPRGVTPLALTTPIREVFGPVPGLDRINLSLEAIGRSNLGALAPGTVVSMPDTLYTENEQCDLPRAAPPLTFNRIQEATPWDSGHARLINEDMALDERSHRAAEMVEWVAGRCGAPMVPTDVVPVALHRRAQAALEAAPPREPSTAEELAIANVVGPDHVAAFLDLARRGEADDFKTLAGAVCGMTPDAAEHFWQGTVRRLRRAST